MKKMFISRGFLFLVSVLFSFSSVYSAEINFDADFVKMVSDSKRIIPKSEYADILGLSPDGLYYLTNREDDRGQTVYAQELSSRKIVKTLKLSGENTSFGRKVLWSPDGSLATFVSADFTPMETMMMANRMICALDMRTFKVTYFSEPADVKGDDPAFQLPQYNPFFSNDGKKLYYIINAAEKFGLIANNVSSEKSGTVVYGKKTALVDTVSKCFETVSGSFVYSLRGRMPDSETSVSVVNIGNGSETVLLRRPLHNDFMKENNNTYLVHDISADGSTVLVCFKEDKPSMDKTIAQKIPVTSELTVLTFSKKEKMPEIRTITHPANLFFMNTVLSRDGRYLISVESNGLVSSFQLTVYDLKNKKSKIILSDEMLVKKTGKNPFARFGTTPAFFFRNESGLFISDSYKLLAGFEGGYVEIDLAAK